tara:strand:+ start:620 stop:1915 length:1296 start_codon:yes stop_codon:yes gene_type:complete
MKFTSKGIAALQPRSDSYRLFCEARRTGLGVQVTPKGRKSWVVRYTDLEKSRQKGKLVRPVKQLGKVASMTLKEAADKAAKIHAESKLAEAQFSFKAEQEQEENESYTFRQAHAAWLKDKTEVAKLVSIDNQNNLLCAHVPSEWWDLPLLSFNKKRITPVIKRLQANYASADVQFQSSLRQIFEIAREEGFWPDERRNPCSGIKWKPNRLRPKRLVMVTPNQLHFAYNHKWARWKTRKDDSDDLARALKIMLLTAQRGIETRNMRWEHIREWKGQTIWDMPPGWIKKHKNFHRHSIPLMPETMQVLGQRQEHGFVFPVAANIDAKTWCYIIKQRQVEDGRKVPFRAHDIRTTFMTTCIDELDHSEAKVDLCISHTPKTLSSAALAYMAGQFIPAKVRIYQDWTNYLMKIVTSATHETGASVRTLGRPKKAV